MTNDNDFYDHYTRIAEGRKERERLGSGKDTRGRVADKFRPTLVKRAQGRVDKDSVNFGGNGVWSVVGNDKLGDHFDVYAVVFKDGKYNCACQGTDRIGGEIRRRGMCSHIIACMLHKEQNGYRVASKAWDGRDVEQIKEDEREKIIASNPTLFNVLDASEGEDPWSTAKSPVDDPEPHDYTDRSQPTDVGSDQGRQATLTQEDRPVYGDDDSPFGALDDFSQRIPAPNDSLLSTSRYPMPDWIESFRSAQWDAVEEIMECYRQGADVVVLDAPTGAGKTLIAELVRRRRRMEFGDGQATFICNSKNLQDQFKRDFPYAKVLKGRSNYRTQLFPFPEVSCSDCTNDRGMAEEAECEWCSEVRTCSYNVARQDCLRDELGILNTAYFLNEANWVGMLSGRDFVIVDECDTLESILMGFVQYELTPRMIENDLDNISVPKKGSHMTTITDWFETELIPTFVRELKKLPKKPRELKDVRKKQRMERALQSANLTCAQLLIDSESWVRDNDAGPMVLKPVKVDWAGERYLWQHGKKWLCMSATVISVDEFGESLGLNISTVRLSGATIVNNQDALDEQLSVSTRPLDYRLVQHPMMFPVENRPIHIVPVANCTYKTMEDAKPRLAKAISRLLEKHPGERVLVHTVSYALATYLQMNVDIDTSRKHSDMLVYTDSQGREAIVERYLKTDGAVLFASSLARGADFKYDACRVCIVAKVPYLSLGDRQISTRTHAKGGQLWYSVQTVRTLVQATGRGVRSETDSCETYILDRQFLDNVWKRNKGLFPGWWQEAVNMGYPTRELL